MTPDTSGSVRVRVAAVIKEADAILLVKHRKGDREYWLLPGGGVDSGESLHDALRRELREELQVESRPGDIVLVNDSIAPDGSRHLVHICLRAEILAGGKPEVGEDPRVVDFEYVPISDLDQLELYPDIGAALVSALQRPKVEPPLYVGNIWRSVDR